MKRILLAAIIVAGLGLDLNVARGQSTEPSTAGSATTRRSTTRPGRRREPLSSTIPDNTRYLNQPSLLASCAKQLALFKDKPCDIIFIGDSITDGWIGPGRKVWRAQYGQRNALDFGIGGDKTQNVIWRLENMDVQHLKPKVAVVLIGTNNTMNTPQEIGDGVKAILDKTQATFSGVKIILVSIMPNQRANDKMMAANTIIKQFADDKSIYYLDLLPVMTPVETTNAAGATDTNWKGLGKDHLHPDASGYQLWADAMEPLLTKLLAGG